MFRSEVADIIDKINFVRWRDTAIKDLQYYYAESEQYVLRKNISGLWHYAFIQARSPKEAADKWNTRPIEDEKDKEIAELKAELSRNADEGYIGFLLGIEQMKKKLAEKDREIEKLKEVVKQTLVVLDNINPFMIYTCCNCYHRKCNDCQYSKVLVAVNTMYGNLSKSINPTDNNVGSMEGEKNTLCKTI